MIIIFTDAFGPSFINNKLLADAYAATTGLRVLVPDIISVGGVSPDSTFDGQVAGSCITVGSLGSCRSHLRLDPRLEHFITLLIPCVP